MTTVGLGIQPVTLWTGLWREHRVLFGRWLVRLRREPLALLALLAQPMVWLLLFGHLFGQMAAVTRASPESRRTYFSTSDGDSTTADPVSFPCSAVARLNV
jgi:hypothetical protein